MSSHGQCFRRVFLFCALLVALLTTRHVSAQSIAPPPWSSPWSSTSQGTLPTDYVAQVLPSAQRSAFQHRSAFGSLCSLAPLACALIDRPFAFNAKLELFIRPKAADGSTSLLLPFAVSVPILGRAEVGLGSCYAMSWASSETSGPQSSSTPATPTGLCPMWVAAKAVLFPLFRDPHKHAALAAEYLLEYQAGPFVGLNQLGLPGPLSKMSLSFRRPIGDLELSGAATVMVDHISRAGTLQIGGHVGYRVPFSEHLWIFGQAILQMPSWGPVLLDATGGKAIDLSPPVGGTLAIGAQQRADFGFGVGMTLMFTRTDIDTRVDLLFRLLSFEVGPHIKPLFPPREKKEPSPSLDVALQTQGANAACPPGMQLALPPVEPLHCIPIAAPPMQCPPGLVPAPAPSAPMPATHGVAAPMPPRMECVSPKPPPPSPLWGHPCEFVPFDGSRHLRVGKIDRSGEYCEWDGLRLPLGAIIAPPEPVHESNAAPTPLAPHPSSSSPVPTSPTTMAQRPDHRTAPTSPTPAQSPPAATPAPLASAPPHGAPAMQPAANAAAPDRGHGDHYDPATASVSGSPLASGFVDRGKKAARHVGEIARVVHDHGIGAVVPSKQDIKVWASDFKEHCLDHVKDCLEKKADEAAQELNDFRNKSWEDKQYTIGGWIFDGTASVAASAVIPGGGAVFGGVVRTGEKAVGKAVAKKAVRRAEAEIIEHADEAAARRLLHEAQERAKKEAEKRAAQEAAEAGTEKAADGAQKLRAKDRRAQERAHSLEERHGDRNFEQPASEGYARWRAKESEAARGKDARRRGHDRKEPGEGDRSQRQLDEDYQ